MKRRRAGRRRLNGGMRPTAPAMAILIALLAPCGQGRPSPQETPAAPASPEAGAPVATRAGNYVISAHLFLIGNIGDVGTMRIEERTRRSEPGRLEKTLRMAGAAYPEQAKKNRDYSGEFTTISILPLRPDGSVDEEAVRDWRDCQKSCSGFLKLNKKYQAEKVEFFRDYAVATRENGTEKRIEGAYDSILSPLEYLLNHDLKVGDVAETPYILNGVPRVFRTEVSGVTTLGRFRSRAYQVDVATLERVADKDQATKDVWRKKGNIRVWICKEGPYKNALLKMKIKFRWYLWLEFDLEKLES